MSTPKWWSCQRVGTTSFAMLGRRQRKKGPNKQRETSTTTFSCWTAMKEARRSTLSVARSEPTRSCGRLLPTASARPIGWVHKTSLEKLQESPRDWEVFVWLDDKLPDSEAAGCWPTVPPIAQNPCSQTLLRQSFMRLSCGCSCCYPCLQVWINGWIIVAKVHKCLCVTWLAPKWGLGSGGDFSSVMELEKAVQGLESRPHKVKAWAK